MSLYIFLLCYAVALARILFPMEAKVAMDIAQVDGTMEFNLGSSGNLPTGIQRKTVDLNDTPFTMKEEHLTRMRALSKTGDTRPAFFIYKKKEYHTALFSSIAVRLFSIYLL